MKLSEAIERVKQEKPHSFSEDHCTLFITEIEAMVQETLGVPQEERIIYNWQTDGGKELIAPAPYDQLYISYLKAKIDYALEEYESYANNQAIHSDDMMEFKKWAHRTGKVKPSDTKIKNWW